MARGSPFCNTCTLPHSVALSLFFLEGVVACLRSCVVPALVQSISENTQSDQRVVNHLSYATVIEHCRPTKSHRVTCVCASRDYLKQFGLIALTCRNRFWRQAMSLRAMSLSFIYFFEEWLGFSPVTPVKKKNIYTFQTQRFRSFSSLKYRLV